jgi:serine/threonine protein kinase
MKQPHPDVLASPPPGDAAPRQPQPTDVWAGQPGQAGHQPALRPGTLVGNCRIESLIGRGGMGEVYLAWHDTLACHRAVKLLLASRGANPDAVERFRREMQLLARLKHVNLAAATDAGQINSLLYLIMEHVPGENLHARVARSGPLPLAEVMQIALQAAHGLEYIHNEQLVHRDLKPSNLMLADDGTVKILDLGIARVAADWSAQPGLTHNGGQGIMGTLEYVSPEQARDPTRVDGRSDLYSLGCSLFELLTGRPPFGDVRGLFEKLKAHAETIPPAVQSLRPETPEALSQIVAKLLAKRPQDRFQSASELIVALEALSAGDKLPLAMKAPDADVAAKERADRGEPAPEVASESATTRSRRIATGIVAAGLVIAATFGTWRLQQWMSRPAEASVGVPKENSNRLEELTVVVAPDGESSTYRLEHKLVSQGIAQLPPTDKRQPLAPSGIFKIRGALSQKAFWHLVWFDTAGAVSVVASSREATADVSYPEDRDDFQSVSPADPAGTHLLALIVQNDDATDGPSKLAAALQEHSTTLPNISARDAAIRFVPAADLNGLQSRLPAAFSVVGGVAIGTKK